jgi:lysophospholipase L1-like esterase
LTLRRVRILGILAAIALIAPASHAPALSQTTPSVTAAAHEPAQTTTADLASKAATAVRQTAAKAAEIFRRVPCLKPKREANTIGSLPHVARKLADGKPVVIVAFGSSSTEGYGSTGPEFTYPNRLAAQLRRHYPNSGITVINSGRGGEDAPEMMRRLKQSVIDAKPDLVIWQVGTNAILRDLDPAATAAQVRDGIAQIQAAGADVVLVDPQYVPAVNRKGERASRMVQLLDRIAGQRHVGLFPRFAVMRDWHEKQSLAFDRFSIKDGLHMNDWGYACFAQLLGDDIIRSVGDVRLGINAPPEVLTYQPL